jgi:non-heme chloroperoxidase
LEVIDFGGTGRPLVLLAGLTKTAHAFDEFATKLTPKYHVYGITRRGFGLSSAPASGYTADRLGADVVAVINALKLVRPILVGHSIAGEEMSYVATHHPEMVAGLIYLEAAYEYALYDQVYGSSQMRYLGGAARILDFVLPAAFENKTIAVFAGQRKFTEIHVPVLAFFAFSGSTKDSDQRSEAEKNNFEHSDRQANALQRQVPTAIIIRLPHASHEIYRSNEADVLREMDAFIKSLP